MIFAMIVKSMIQFHVISAVFLVYVYKKIEIIFFSMFLTMKLRFGKEFESGTIGTEIFAGMDFATSDDIVEKLLVVILCTSLWCLQAFVINTRSESPPVVLTKFVVSICVCVQAMVMTWKFVTSVTEQQI